MVFCLLGLSVYVTLVPDSTIVSGAGFAASVLLMIWHLVFMGMFWNRTMEQLENTGPDTDSNRADPD